MPASALGQDPFTNLIHVTGKALLGRELFRFQRYAQMDALVTSLLPKLDKLRFSDDDEKDKGSRNQLRYELVDIQLYARYGQALAAMAAEDHSKAAALIDPLIDALTKAGESQEKVNLQKNPQLATSLLTTALKANLQQGKIERTEAVLTALNAVTDNKGNTTDILSLMAYLIRTQVEEIRKKGDQAGLDTAIKGYSAILSKQIAKVKGQMSNDFIRVLADCYSSMGQHEKAATELGKATLDPKVRPDSPEDKMQKTIQVLQVRELRLSKTPANIKKARELMDKMRTGDGKKPGWAMQNLSALMEHATLLEAEEKWKDAFPVWAALVKNLVKHVEKGGHIKEFYFECYFHMVLCFTKIGLTEPSKTDRDKYLKTAAQQIASFQGSWGDDFGSETSKKRFTDLLTAEKALKEQYDMLKKK
jgi:tetratricopeptide (TPR) repeat protein